MNKFLLILFVTAGILTAQENKNKIEPYFGLGGYLVENSVGASLATGMIANNTGIIIHVGSTHREGNEDIEEYKTKFVSAQALIGILGLGGEVRYTNKNETQLGLIGSINLQFNRIMFSVTLTEVGSLGLTIGMIGLPF